MRDGFSMLRIELDYPIQFNEVGDRASLETRVASRTHPESILRALTNCVVFNTRSALRGLLPPNLGRACFEVDLKVSLNEPS